LARRRSTIAGASHAVDAWAMILDLLSLEGSKSKITMASEGAG
jgi:hypothetical protein